MSIIVGDTGCTYIQVLNTLKKSAVFDDVCDKWKTVARALDCSETWINTMHKSIIIDMVTFDDIYMKMFTQWRSRKSNEATLTQLILSFETCELKTAADLLRREFRVVQTPETTPVKPEPEPLLEIQKARFKKQRDHIGNNLADLVSLTDVNTMVIVKMQQCKVLDPTNVSELNAIQDNMKRAARFYDLVQRKQGFFQPLLETMLETCQQGVTAILNQLMYD